METTQSGAEQHCKPLGKAAAYILARVFEEESTASPSADRVKDVRTQTRAVLQNTATDGFDPCMTECLTLRELEEALQKIKQGEEGSGTWWNHKWNAETPGPWSKIFPTAHPQPKLVDRYCTNSLEGSPYKTHDPSSSPPPPPPAPSPPPVCSAVLESLLRGSSTKGSHGILSQTQF